MNWIDVNDRLPTKENKDIICLINGKCVLANVHDADISLIELSFYWPKNSWIKNKYYSDVTHWMPIPLPPKI